MANTQARILVRPIRFVRLRGLWPVYYLVPCWHRSDRRSFRDTERAESEEKPSHRSINSFQPLSQHKGQSLNLKKTSAGGIALNADPWQAHEVRVMQVIPETLGVATYELEFVDPAFARDYHFLPGQFNMLYVPGIGESAISISSPADSPEFLRHTIRAVGGVTDAIAAGGKGMSLGLRGPFGSSWPTESCIQHVGAPKDVLLVAGGIGLAPLRSAIYELIRYRERLARIVLLIGSRTADDLLYLTEYETWKEQGIEVHTTVDKKSEGWEGNVGVVTALLNQLQLAQPENTVLMTCGPEVMMHHVAESALHLQIRADNIWLSLERNMNCAIGICGHCQLGPEFLCKDGPVLAYPRVAEWLKVQGL